jgi:hypothetical protein
MPPAVGAGLFGSMNDAWQVPMADVGPAGDDRGKGGRYLLLPPGAKTAVPRGYFPVQFTTINGYCFMRVIPEGSAPADIQRAIDLVSKIQIYPLSKATNPTASRHIDMAGKLYNGIPEMDDTFYDRLATILNEEAIQTRDLVALGQFRTLGYEHGKPFTPDAKTRALLKEGAREAQAFFIESFMHQPRFFPDRQWQMGAGPIATETGFSFQAADFLDVDKRGTMFYMACGLPKKLGTASFYLNGVLDAAGKPLDGSASYTLHVLPNVPAKQFWATTIYDFETGAFVRESPKIEVNSYQDLQKNADGSVDLYFSSKAPAGKESNWAYTAPGKPWFMVFRFYGPEKPLSEKTWQLPDIEITK